MRRAGMRISQTKLGQAVGVTFQQVQKYESGTNRVGASNLFRIARALGVDVTYFFEGAPGEGAEGMTYAVAGMHDTPQMELDDPTTSRESLELMHSFFRIPDPQVRRRLLQLVRTLAGSSAGE